MNNFLEVANFFSRLKLTPFFSLIRYVISEHTLLHVPMYQILEEPLDLINIPIVNVYLFTINETDERTNISFKNAFRQLLH